MENLVIVRLKYSGGLTEEWDIVHKHEDIAYETTKMFKGYDSLDGTRVNRRIYKSEIGIPKLKVSDSDIINLKEGEWIRVYVEKEDTKKALKDLKEVIKQKLEILGIKIEEFLDTAIELTEFLDA